MRWLFLLVSLASLPACGPCDLEAQAAGLTGPDPTYCDEADRGLDRDPAVDCVVGAFQQQRPFRYERMLPSRDGQVVEALVGDQHGNVYDLVWDAGLHSDGGTIRQFRCLNPRVEDYACGDAWHLDRNTCDGPTLVCDALEAMGQVCP